MWYKVASQNAAMVPRPNKRTTTMKTIKTLLTAGAVLAWAGSAANAWTDRYGHWHEGPTLYGPVSPGAVYAPYGVAPAYGYGPMYGGPVIVTRPPTDTQVAIDAGLNLLGAVLRGF